MNSAVLILAAIQSVSQEDEDGFTAYWSESHVSEDFDIALRLQVAGDTVRLASYHNDEFKEGVSLTIYDELTRWEKYVLLRNHKHYINHRQVCIRMQRACVQPYSHLAVEEPLHQAFPDVPDEPTSTLIETRHYRIHFFL